MITYKLQIKPETPKRLRSDMEFVTGDTGAYRLEFTFVNNGVPMDLTGKRLSVRVKRADGKTYCSGGSVEGNTAVFVPENGLYAIPGELVMEIALYNDTQSYMTTKIVTAQVIEGIGKPDNDAEEQVSVYVTLLSQLSDRVDAAEALYKDKADKAEVMPVQQITETEAERLLSDGMYYVSKYDDVAQTVGFVPYLLVVRTSGSGISSVPYQLRIGKTSQMIERRFRKRDGMTDPFYWTEWEAYQTESQVDAKQEAVFKKAESDARYFPHGVSEGVPAVTAHAVAGAVLQCTVHGSSMQQTEPTMENPAEIQSVGDLVTDTDSDYFGKYKVTVTVTASDGTQKAYAVYLDAPLRKAQGSRAVADYIDWSAQKVVRHTGRITFDGTENWTTYTHASGVKSLARTIKGSINSIYFVPWCTRSSVEAGVVGKESYVGMTCVGGGSAVILWRETDVTKEILQERLKTWHDSGSPLEVVYALETPVEESITAEPVLLGDGENTVAADTSVAPSNITVTYCQNPTEVIEELRNAILAQGGNV